MKSSSGSNTLEGFRFEAETPADATCCCFCALERVTSACRRFRLEGRVLVFESMPTNLLRVCRMSCSCCSVSIAGESP